MGQSGGSSDNWNADRNKDSKDWSYEVSDGHERYNSDWASSYCVTVVEESSDCTHIWNVSETTF